MAPSHHSVPVVRSHTLSRTQFPHLYSNLQKMLLLPFLGAIRKKTLGTTNHYTWCLAYSKCFLLLLLFINVTEEIPCFSLVIWNPPCQVPFQLIFSLPLILILRQPKGINYSLPSSSAKLFVLGCLFTLFPWARKPSLFLTKISKVYIFSKL